MRTVCYEAMEQMGYVVQKDSGALQKLSARINQARAARPGLPTVRLRDSTNCLPAELVGGAVLVTWSRTRNTEWVNNMKGLIVNLSHLFCRLLESFWHFCAAF